MLRVVSTTPAFGAIGVNPETPLTIVFDKAVNTSTITNANILLFNTDVGYNIPLTFEITNSDQTVTITPDTQLLENTKYVLVIRGDFDQTDGVHYGVIGFDDTNLESNETGIYGNYQLEFTTGLFVSGSTDSPHIIDTTYAQSYSSTQTQTTTESVYLNMISSTPRNTAINVTNLNNMTTKWSHNISGFDIASGDLVIIERVPMMVENDDYTVLYNENVELNNQLSAVHVGNDVVNLTFSGDVDIIANSEYFIIIVPRSLYADTIIDESAVTLRNDTEVIRFLSPPTHKYASIGDIATKIPSTMIIEPYKIEYLIIEASLLIRTLLGNRVLTSKELQYVKQYVICYVLSALWEINNSPLTSSGDLIEKELLGWRVKYASPQKDENKGKNPYDDCMNHALALLGLKFTAINAVKSAWTVNYPGRRRYIKEALERYFKETSP